MTQKTPALTIVIDPASIQKEYLKDVFRYRELFFFLAWRDIIVRYKQTFLGVLWAIIRPLITLAVFSFVFGKIANLAHTQQHYSLFVLSGLLPWLLFSNSLAETSNSLVSHAHIITKTYFPRMILVMSTIMVHLLDFLIGFTILTFFLLVTQTLNIYTFWLFPFFILLAYFLSLGAGLWLAAINVRYRDFRFIVPFLIQFGVFISPIGYSSFLLSDLLLQS